MLKVCIIAEDASFKKYIIKALTDIKYKVNLIIANQNDERTQNDVCTTCKKNQDEKNEEEENLLVSSMFPIKNYEELLKFERFLVDEQNRTKLVRYLFF